jgi:sulfite reductase (NADPH) flavoprotein alpha-component
MSRARPSLSISIVPKRVQRDELDHPPQSYGGGEVLTDRAWNGSADAESCDLDRRSPGTGSGSMAGSSLTVDAITVFFATETGASEEIANAVRDGAAARGLAAKVVDLADADIADLADIDHAIFVVSTTGEGDAPYAAENFFTQVESGDAPRLAHLRYAIAALGDSTYAQFCAAGRRLDEGLARLGAVRLLDRVDCDIDYDEPAAGWREAVLNLLAGPAPETSAAASPSDLTQARLIKYRAVEATVVDNRLLVGAGSTKATRHLAIAFENSETVYVPGDALGIIVSNDVEVVASLLAATGLDPQATVELAGAPFALFEALRDYCEVTTATPRFLEYWAALSASVELVSLLTEERAAERRAYLRDHHIVDIVRKNSMRGLDAQGFVQSLRPLQPRLYSIASSMRAVGGEAHLAIAPVAYSLRGEARQGVATGMLCDRTPLGTRLSVYVQPNSHFRLPADDVPIVMIGAGTGVAPYRAFLQERTPASGPAWLIFGERNRATDFLYEADFRAFENSGSLTRLDTAFSRDGEAKVYVQHRIAEHATELGRWVTRGAHIYVCGDAADMAPAVHSALLRALEEGLNMSADAAEIYVAAMQREGRYQRDVY